VDELTVGPGTIRLVRGDITEQRVAAVVNAANSTLMGGGGVDGAIHRKGGPSILAACKRIRAEDYPDGLPTGQAVATTAGDLPAEAVIHTVGPRWSGGSRGEEELLASAYERSLAVARERGWRVVAFPSISTGIYGYPVGEAAAVALRTIRRVLEDHPGSFDEVRMVLFSGEDLDAYRRALDGLD
jgi:O-acetyl-ADP-ribose deacetylase (regulator of RNase III)